MSKRETTGPTRREQRRAERRRTSFLWNAIILGTLGVTLLLVIGFWAASQRPGPLPGERVIPDEGRAVIAEGSGSTPSYSNHPPSSGTHYDKPAPWGLAETAVPEATYLNNLARGGIVILYQCPTECPELEQQFAELLKKAPKDSQFNAVKILISPYAARELPAPIVALAWRHQLDLQAYDEQTLLTWYRRFVNQGPNNGP